MTIFERCGKLKGIYSDRCITKEMLDILKYDKSVFTIKPKFTFSETYMAYTAELINDDSFTVYTKIEEETEC